MRAPVVERGDRYVIRELETSPAGTGADPACAAVQDDRDGAGAALKIGLMSPCGLGNLGDAAIQEAVIGRLRSVVPDAEFVAFTLNPEDTRSRHGVASHPLTGRGAAGQGVQRSGADRSPGRVTRLAKRIEDRLFDVRYVGRLWSIGLAAVETVQCEARHSRMALRQLQGMDLLVVSGGGQLDDFWGGAWGHPYAMFKWALLAALSGVPVVVLGVGVGVLRTPLSRYFVRWTLRIAQYRSYRDRESAQMAEDLGVRQPHVHSADLAFGLVPDRVSPRRPGKGAAGRRRGRSVVGISPMAYRDPRVWPRKQADVYRNYVSKLAELCTRLASSGKHEVVLFATTRSDMRTVRDVYDEVQRTADGQTMDDVSVASTATIDELFEVVSELEFAVASRLHGVLLSHLVGCPVVALSYDRKVDRHMESMGQAEYDLSIDDFTVDSCLRTLRGLEMHSEESRAVLNSRVREHARRVRADVERAVSILAGERVVT